MCFNGFESGDTEDEREGAEPWETDGDLAFLPEVDWRIGQMGPEEKAFRELLEGDDDLRKRNNDGDADGA